MRNKKWLYLCVTALILLSACAEQQPAHTPEIVVSPSSTITFRWHSLPYEANFTAYKIGEDAYRVLTDPSIESFQLTDGRKTYQLTKSKQGEGWKFQCLGFYLKSECFFIEKPAFDFRHPADSIITPEVLRLDEQWWKLSFEREERVSEIIDSLKHQTSQGEWQLREQAFTQFRAEAPNWLQKVQEIERNLGPINEKFEFTLHLVKL